MEGEEEEEDDEQPTTNGGDLLLDFGGTGKFMNMYMNNLNISSQYNVRACFILWARGPRWVIRACAEKFSHAPSLALSCVLE